MCAQLRSEPADARTAVAVARAELAGDRSSRQVAEERRGDTERHAEHFAARVQAADDRIHCLKAQLDRLRDQSEPSPRSDQ